MTDYRRGAFRCPGCGETMVASVTKAAHVDRCPRCAGLWIDWMDGEVEQVVRSLPHPRSSTGPQAEVGVCPVCATALHEERALAAPVWRCGACVGAFVPAASLDVLTGETDGAGQGGEAAPLLTRLLDALGSLLTPG